MERLPVDSEIEVLKFLTVFELCQVACVNWSWNQTSETDELWRLLCARRWKDKQCKNVETFEQGDTEQALRSKKEINNDEEMAENVSSGPQSISSQDGAIVTAESSSAWKAKATVIMKKRTHKTNRQRVWKERYRMAEEDSKRTRITLEELTSICWSFFMRGFMWSEHSPERITRNHMPAHDYPRFNRDHTYTSKMFPRTMSWQFVLFPQKVQVARYPPLQVSRTSDWGWRLSNPFVELYSLDASTAAVVATIELRPWWDSGAGDERIEGSSDGRPQRTNNVAPIVAVRQEQSHGGHHELNDDHENGNGGDEDADNVERKESEEQRQRNEEQQQRRQRNGRSHNNNHRDRHWNRNHLNRHWRRGVDSFGV